MGIRALLVAAAAFCLIPAVASAQAVPPRKPPPQDERVPVVMDGAGKAATVVGGGATIVDALATRARDGAAALDEARDVDLTTGNGSIMDHPLADPHGKTIQAGENISGVAKGVAGGAAVVQLGTSAYAAADKCGAEKVDGSDCAQAGLSLVSSTAGAMDAVAATPGLARLAGGAQLAADAVALHKNCVSDQSNVGQCVLSSFDATMTATGMVPGGQAISAGYSVAKTILPAAVDKGYASIFGQSPGAHLYDLFNGDADAKALADAGSPAALEAARAKRHAAYNQASGTLQSKQADYEAQQAEIQRQQIAAQQQSQAQAQSQAQSQAMIQNLVGNLQAMSQPRSPRTVVAAITPPVSQTPVASPTTYPAYTPPPPQPAYTPPPVAAAPTGCHSGHNEARHPGGCHSAPISGTSR